ncbi:MAG: hypothetical protein RR806_07450 [Oscillospiraceae bacterium]
MRTYTLAQLKRDCKAKILKAEMTIRCGDTDIPERLQGIRPLVDSNSVAIFFLNSDGKQSEMQIKRSKLVEYTDDTLTIFYPAKRDFNEKEQKIMDGWNKIASTDEYKQRSDMDALTDGSSTYYQEKAYFGESECPYLFGFEESCGCKYDINSKKIVDYSLKSDDIEMQYKLYRN